MRFVGLCFALHVCRLHVDSAPVGDDDDDDNDDKEPFVVEVTLAGLSHDDDDLSAPIKFEIKVVPEWSPLGASRFRQLIAEQYYDGAAIFRVIPGFMAQFGIAADMNLAKKWQTRKLKDDPRVPAASNTRGTISFASSGANTRTTQMFINYGDNSRLDAEGFTPFGVVVGTGMVAVDSIYAVGEGPPAGKGVEQGRLWQREATDYLEEKFPQLSYIERIRVTEGGKDDEDEHAAIAAKAHPKARKERLEQIEEQLSDKKLADMRSKRAKVDAHVERRKRDARKHREKHLAKHGGSL